MLSGDTIELLRSLNHGDKLYAIQLLISDLVKEEADFSSESSSPDDDASDAQLGYKREELEDEMV
jgi:hypothetical protein